MEYTESNIITTRILLNETLNKPLYQRETRVLSYNKNAPGRGLPPGLGRPVAKVNKKRRIATN
jgi:hypothetical protein